MSYEGFTIEKADGTAVVAINMPPANTYNFELMKELDAIIEDVRLDTDINVIILTGSEKIFSAGADINMLKQSDPRYKAMFCLHCQETLMELERIPKIAAITGTVSAADWRSPWPAICVSCAPMGKSAFRKSHSACCPARVERSACRASSARPAPST